MLRRESEKMKTEIDKLDLSFELKTKELQEIERQKEEAKKREVELDYDCNEIHKRVVQKQVDSV
jgi:hypothetical protein